MIEIKPDLKVGFRCPECNCSDISVSRIVFPGIRVLADCSCFCCEIRFFADLPIGHALYYPKYLVQKDGKVYPEEKKMNWFSRQLWESYKTRNSSATVSIKKKILKETGSTVIVLNCLDYLYGHVLLKLFNAERYFNSQPEISLILILPVSFEWLVPEGTAEVWLVDLGLSKLKGWYEAVDVFVQGELSRFEKVYLSPAYSHPDLSQIEISKFTKVEAFPIQKFDSAPKVLTFIYREDRLWHGSNLEEFVYLNLLQIKALSFLKKPFVYFQNRRVSNFLKHVKKQVPGIQINLVGIGNSSNFPAFIQDRRTTKINEATEKEWCTIYASSQLVVGIHGSNMLLPTALAAGSLEILPDSRIGNMTQDIFPRHAGKFLLYLCRHVSNTLAPRRIADHAIWMLSGFAIFELYNSEKNLPYKPIEHPESFSKEYKERTSKNKR